MQKRFVLAILFVYPNFVQFGFSNHQLTAESLSSGDNNVLQIRQKKKDNFIIFIGKKIKRMFGLWIKMKNEKGLGLNLYVKQLLII